MSVELRETRTFRVRLLAVAAFALLAAGIVTIIVRDDDPAEPRPVAAQSFDCIMAFSGFTQGTPVGMARYLLDQRLTRGGYPERGQRFYEEALDDLRERDPHEPLGKEPLGRNCDDLEDGDLDQLPSAFDDEQPAEAIVLNDEGRFEQAELADVVRQLRLDPKHGQPVYARVEGTAAMLVVARPSGERAAYTFSDADKDGTYIESDSEGLRVPAYKSNDGSAVLGVAFFSSTAFEFAYTAEPGAVSASLSSEGFYLPIFEVYDGVADLSDAWGIALECDKPFTVTWMAKNGAPVDELTDTFYCSPVE